MENDWSKEDKSLSNLRALVSFRLSYSSSFKHLHVMKPLYRFEKLHCNGP